MKYQYYMQSKAIKTAVPTDLVELSPKKTIGDWKAIRDQLSAGVSSQILEGVMQELLTGGTRLV